VLQSPAATTPAALANDRTLGDSTAPVTIDVWSDFQCPFCEQFWTSVEPKLITTFIQPHTARLVYHDYTFIGPESKDAAVAARCADLQGKFWPYHDYLFANQGQENSGAFSAARLAEIATAVGVNLGLWRPCLTDPAIAQAIQQETAAGQAAGINGTPTVAVNGVKLAAFDFNTISAAVLSASSAAPAGAAAPSASVP
jgi:protein-disulfide isomerase